MLQIPKKAVIEYLKHMLTTNITKKEKKRFRKGLVNLVIEAKEKI